MNRRINISLPEETVGLLDRVAPRGDRSHLIAEAVKFYVEHTGRAQLRKRLKEGAIRRAERDRQLAGEWFFLDEELWRRTDR
jgi:CopG family transcriptional regulator/antitoxin EndoAI